MNTSWAVHHRLLFIVLAASALLAALTLLLWSSQGAAQAAADEIVAAGPLTDLADSVAGREGGPIGATNCRIGVSLGNQTDHEIQYQWITQLKLGWFINFYYGTEHVPENTEYMPLIAVHQDQDEDGNYLPSYFTNRALTDAELGADIARYPGAVWIVGNEIDRVGQGDIFPDIYAIAYHDIYHFIKERDPTARVAVSGLVQVTPMRIQYLDLLWASYAETFGSPMPVDVWTFHVYILAEVAADGVTPASGGVALGTDIALAKRLPPNGLQSCPDPDVYCFAEHDSVPIFMEHVTAMRQWMNAHGYRNTPLILSEYSILMPYVLTGPNACWVEDENNECFDPDRVSAYLEATFDFLDSATNANIGYPHDNNRLVQQWLWYSMGTTADTGGASDIINDNGTQLTQVGRALRDEINARPLQVNVFPVTVWGLAGPLTPPDNTATAVLQVGIKNNGNTYVGQAYTVTFYENLGLTIPIASTTVATTPGCASGEVTATVEWPDLPPGTHQFWVKLDSLNEIPETNESDNLVSGFVVVDPFLDFLPVVLRSTD